MTIKDTLDVEGWATTAGVVSARDRIAGRDSSVVRRLREAGAIVVAKTNVPECSSDAETDNALFGRTDNPHDKARTPGGSSGGEAALMGADASLVGIGVDGGCSIRLPSHYCGGVGIRPTAGRVPETGLWPSTRATGMFDLSCIGPMGRYVEDLELLLGVIAGADGVDPLAPPVPVPGFGAIDGPLRVGFYVDDPHTVPTAATVEAVRRAAEAIGGRAEGAPGSRRGGGDRPASSGWAPGSVEEIAAPPAADANDVVFGAIGADGGAHIKEVAGEGPPPTASRTSSTTRCRARSRARSNTRPRCAASSTSAPRSAPTSRSTTSSSVPSPPAPRRSTTRPRPKARAPTPTATAT